jgi:hypothetical protein
MSCRHVKGKPGTESFDSQLSRYILYKATEDEVDKAVAQLTAGAVRDSSDGDHDDGAAFFIDATGVGEVRQADVLPVGQWRCFVAAET